MFLSLQASSPSHRAGILLAVAEDGGHVVLGPVGEGADDGEEGAGTVGQGILDAGRDFGIDRAADVAVGLEGAEGAGEHFLRDVGDATAQDGEAEALLGAERVDDEERPFVADAGEDATDGAVGEEGFFERGGHKRLSFALNSLVLGFERFFCVRL